MNRYIFFTILLLFLLTSLLHSGNESKVIVFDKIGQKEQIKIGEKITAVLGNNIKPEFCYFVYKTGKNSDEFSIELKSNESYLMEIYKLRNQNDSIVYYLKQIRDLQKILEDSKLSNKEILPQHDTIEIRKTQISQKNTQVPPERNYSIFDYNISKKRVDSIRTVLKEIDESIERNNIVIGRNASRIDTIKNKLSSIDNIEELNKLKNELDSLIKVNQELVDRNKGLNDHKLSLEQELLKEVTLMGFLIKILTFVVIITFLIIILTYFIYRNYRQKKKFNIVLSNINEELENKNEELNKLLSMIKKDLKKASEYILSIIPEKISNGSPKTDWVFIPSADLGGDTLGFNWVNSDNFAFYIVDVSGHGTGSALHSVQILNTLKTMSLPNVDFANPKEVMNALNKIFQMEDHNNVYFTMIYCVYNIITNKLKYSNAGHPPAIFLDNQKTYLLESQNIFIGANPNITYSYDELNIHENATIYLYSDGAYEYKLPNGEMFDFNEFIELVTNKSRSELLNIYNSALNNTNNKTLDDDFTILKVQF